MPQVLFSFSISVKGYFSLPVFRQKKISDSSLTFSVFHIPHLISQCILSAHPSKLHHLSPPPLLQFTHREWMTVFPYLDSCLSPQWSFHLHLCTAIFSDSLWPHGLASPWNSPGQNTGVGSLSLLRGIFPIQRSNPSLPNWRRVLYQLSYQGSPLLNTGL